MDAPFSSASSLVRVRIATTPPDNREFRFSHPFRIGRAEDCEVSIASSYVSRTHAEVFLEDGQWWIRDLASANGMFVNNSRVERSPIPNTLAVRLGVEGPWIGLQLEPILASRTQSAIPIPQQREPYAAPAAAAGSHTFAALPTSPSVPIQPAPEEAHGDTIRTPATGGGTAPPASAEEPPPSETMMVAAYVDKYFGKGTVTEADQPVGERTMMVRRAFQHVQKKQKRKYGWIIGGLAFLVVAAGGFAYYEHQQTLKQRALAQDIFYSMKALDVDIAGLQKMIAESHSARGAEQVQKYRTRRRDMEKNYDKFLSSLRVYNPKMTEQDRLVLRVARIFGECELNMPPGFVEEVQNYIKKWQSSPRLAKAIGLAREKGYTAQISSEFLSQDLPPQFFYLGLQESSFDAYISGPPTYMGIAKGMWQFIPQTATKYGLRIGPLADQRRPDPSDDRHNWQLATRAAARYIKDLYATDAQASGLLVMASYNWGEDKVIKYIREMPPNPRERNFWKLLELYRDKLPQETYDYVFYITSAAVIGENPRLFGFDFDNPLVQP
jgi:membrane-bound lytic murein transglycosylase D